jgi:hypothetical protein
MVSYLIPYSGERTYRYTAPVDIARMNFVLPAESNLSLTGAGITGPEPMTLQDNESYMVYSRMYLKAGQTLNIILAGISTISESSEKNPNNLFAVGAAFLGFAVLGVGVWWWRQSAQVEEEGGDPVSNEPTFDDLITEIALLVETYEQKEPSVEEYQSQRGALLKQAKRLSS